MNWNYDAFLNLVLPNTALKRTRLAACYLALTSGR